MAGTGGGFTPPGTPECPYAPRMTRAQAMALRTAGGLKENCVVVITDGPTIGTAGNTSLTEIELNPVSPTELGTTARVHTGFAASAWPGVYDIDLGTAGSITALTDDWGNSAKDIDADSPTVHTEFPWHLGNAFFRDNYAEDAVLTAWDTQGTAATSMINNRVIDSTVNLTGKGNGGFLESEFLGTTWVNGAGFTTIIRAKITGGTLNMGAGTATGTVSLNSSDVRNCTFTRDGTVTGGFTLNNTDARDSTITQGAGSTGSINVTDSQITATSQLNIDPGSAKGIFVSISEFLGYSIRTKDAGAGSTSVSRSNCFGKPTTGDSILHHGTNAGGTGPGISVGQSVVDGFSFAGAGQGSIDVNGPASSALIQDAAIQNSRFTIGPGAGAFQTTGGIYEQANINALSSTGGRLTINFSYVTGGGTVNHAAASTDSMNVNTCHVDGTGGLIELLSGARGLSLTNTYVTNGIIRQTTVNAANVPNLNQVNDCRVLDLGRIIFSETGPVGFFGSSVNRSEIRGNSLGAGVDGILTITGTSAQVLTDALDIRGICTLTDVPQGALSAGTSFHDNHVGPGSTLTYTAGDAIAKQVRNNVVEGLSSLVITSLTGSAGLGLADVFTGRVANQSTMTVDGARVAGQPVRNFEVVNGSALNVAASGTVLQVQVRAGATLNTGANRISETIIEGAFVKTATASQQNRLCSKAYDDVI